MNSPRPKRHREPLVRRKSEVARASPVVEGGSAAPHAAHGLTRGIGTETEVLVTLRALLGPEAFWHPKTLSAFKTEVLDAYVDQHVAARDRDLVACLRALRPFPAWERLKRMSVAVGSRLDCRHGPAIKLSEDHHLLAICANLPGGLDSPTNPQWILSREITWLPEGFEVLASADFQETPLEELPAGLSVSGWLDLAGCAKLCRIADGLWVGRNLILSACMELRDLAEGVHVGGDLVLDGCGLARFTESEIRAKWDIGGHITGLSS